MTLTIENYVLDFVEKIMALPDHWDDQDLNRIAKEHTGDSETLTDLLVSAVQDRLMSDFCKHYDI
tara:strand:- start:142 stop:336 length:195 start_codon:yes stop_codon:yes gene_type:complete